MRNALNLHSSSELNYQISKLSMQVQTKAKSLQDDEKRLKKLKGKQKKDKRWFCKGCNAINNANDDVCWNCGTGKGRVPIFKYI